MRVTSLRATASILYAWKALSRALCWAACLQKGLAATE